MLCKVYHCCPKLVLLLNTPIKEHALPKRLDCKIYTRQEGSEEPQEGGIPIFSHIRRLGLFFWVQNSEFQYFLGFSEKMNIFGGMKMLWIFSGVITKLG